MAEELYFKINSDVSSAVKGADDYTKSLEQAEANVNELNESLKAQNKFILEQEKELLKLKTTQDSVAKGSWNAGAIKRAEDIQVITAELKSNKLALKEIKLEQKDATQAVKEYTKAQGDTSKGLLESIKNFKVMGFSINGVGKGMKKVIPTIKKMFSSIKMGIASTGIGLLVIAVGSLIAYFTRTKKGAELLQNIFAGLGAVMNVLLDRVAKLGEIIVSVFTLDLSGAWEGLKTLFTGVGDEMQREMNLAVQLQRELHHLEASTRMLNVQRAESAAIIEQLKEKAQDLNKTEEERIGHLEHAALIETALLEKSLKNAEKALSIQTRAMTMSDNKIEDLQKMADLEIEIANIKRKSAKVTRSLLKQTNSIQKSVAAEEERRQNKWLAKQQEIKKANMKLVREAHVIVRELALREIEDLQKLENALLTEEANKKKKIIADSKLSAKNKKIATELVNDLLLSDLKIMNAKYKKIEEDRAQSVADRLEQINNEIKVSAIKGEYEKQIALLEIQKGADDDAIDQLNATLEEKGELKRASAIKYAGIKEELFNEEVEREKGQAKELQAFKEELAIEGLNVILTGIQVQEQALTNQYNQDVKLAEANGESIENIEKDYQAKMVANAKKQKAVSIGLAIVDTYQSAVAAYNNALAIPGAGIVMAPIAAGLAVATGLANVAMIAGTDVGDGGGGGGSISSGTLASAPPAPEMMSGSFDISGGVAPEPIQAFVVTDEMTSSQNQLANIRRRATI